MPEAGSGTEGYSCAPHSRQAAAGRERCDASGEQQLRPGAPRPAAEDATPGARTLSRALGRTIGIDTGGTFTDLVLAADGELRLAKVPSTPRDPVRAILSGLELLGGVRPGDQVVHGTTVALNALLAGRAARVALVTNEGFADLLEIGRQERPDIYALHPEKTPPLVPPALRFEVRSRIWPEPSTADGRRFTRVQEPTRRELEELARAIQRSGARSIAVCLLHSYAEPAIEERVARALARLGLPITCSARVLREHREVERFSTAVVNAALVPLMRDYLGSLGARLAPARLALLQSSGGTLPAQACAETPVRVLFSGPAGGVVGAARAARETGCASFVGLDMGGTSTDVAFHDSTGGGTGARSSGRALEPAQVAGLAVAVPALDIHTIGCGGGSLVTIDAGGILHVGPRSAGADPGPVAYGKSDVPTVTDAHVFLGHIAEGPFLGGRLDLDGRAVRAAFARLARQLRCEPREAARAVLDVARAAMRRAIGVMTMQRGQDPERLPLVAFGGAGGLHACALAQSLGMRGALVPLHPGALSALGMTAAEPLCDLEHTVLEPLASRGARAWQRELHALAARAREELQASGVPARAIRIERALDLRYVGQSFEIRVADGRDPAAAFHRAHAACSGYALPEREIELGCLRARAAVASPPPAARRARARRLPASALRERRTAVFDRPRRALVLRREELPPGCRFTGPALIEEYSGTTLVPHGWRARVTAHGHLWLERGRG